MKHVYFFTGFPGFIASKLIKEMIAQDSDFDFAYLLVLPSFQSKGEKEAEKLKKEMDLPSHSLQVITGDITKVGLDIDRHIAFEEITHVFHLAAIYDLAVPKNIAYEVNVNGTKNVNDWVKQLPVLKRYVYFSTAYVAGTREGRLLETELIKPPAFKNFYEETKYEAEVLVEQLKQDVPVTIIRPGIVKGHSVTGETVKFDGPYFILNTIHAVRFMPIIPYIGKSQTSINLVPVDFIIKAVSFLALYENGAGKTYHLTDPNPYTSTEVYEMLMEEMLKKKPKGTISISLCNRALAYKPIREFLHTERETTDYFTWKGEFDCSVATADLDVAGIRCPDFKEGVPSMVDFYLKNRKNPDYQVAIR